MRARSGERPRGIPYEHFAVPDVAGEHGIRSRDRFGVMRALNRNVERVFDPSRKDHHWGRRKLVRDR